MGSGRMGVYRLISLLSDLVRPCLALFAGRVRSPRLMKSFFQSVCLASLGVTLFSPFLWAHHSFEAEYDSNKPVTVKGVLAQLDWENPHVFFYVDVKDEGGGVVEH